MGFVRVPAIGRLQAWSVSRLVVLGAGTIPGWAAWLRDAGAGDGPVAVVRARVAMASTASRSDNPCWRHSDRQVQNDTAWPTTARSRRRCPLVQLPDRKSTRLN